MELYFLRHGDAVPENAWSGRDADRPLTERGRAQIRELAFLMTAQGVAVDRILSSAAKRALDSALIVKEGCGWTIPVEEHDLLGLSTSPGALLAFLNALPAMGRYLLVGHEPTLGDAIRLLVAGPATGRRGRGGGGGDGDGDQASPAARAASALGITMPKGSLFRVDVTPPVEPGCGTLYWQIPASAGPAIA